MSFFRTIVLVILVIISIGFFNPTFAEPTVRDLNVNLDAQNGTEREGYIETFKSGF